MRDIDIPPYIYLYADLRRHLERRRYWLWANSDYKSRVHLNLRDLTKNHLGKLAKLKFDFIEYKVAPM